jgi:hypothetical protein
VKLGCYLLFLGYVTERRRLWTAGMIPSFHVERWLSARWVITDILLLKSFTLEAADNRSRPKPSAVHALISYDEQKDFRVEWIPYVS